MYFGRHSRNRKSLFVVICTKLRRFKYLLIMHGFLAFHFLYALQLTYILKVGHYQKADTAGT